jgi:uncharacterized protein YlxW (UPF0749 family)
LKDEIAKKGQEIREYDQRQIIPLRTEHATQLQEQKTLHQKEILNMQKDSESLQRTIADLNAKIQDLVIEKDRYDKMKQENERYYRQALHLERELKVCHIATNITYRL